MSGHIPPFIRALASPEVLALLDSPMDTQIQPRPYKPRVRLETMTGLHDRGWSFKAYRVRVVSAYAPNCHNGPWDTDAQWAWRSYCRRYDPNWTPA